MNHIQRCGRTSCYDRHGSQRNGLIVVSYTAEEENKRSWIEIHWQTGLILPSFGMHSLGCFSRLDGPKDIRSLRDRGT